MELSDKLELKFRLDENQKKALRKLGLFSVYDMLFYFPTRYSDISQVKQIADLIPGEIATVYGKVSKLKTKKSYHGKVPMAEGQIEDLSGKIKITWFNQAYLAKMLHEGENVKLTGKVTESKYGIYLANPEFEKTSDLPIDSHDTLFNKSSINNSGFSYPIYHETRGITSKWFYHAIEKILKDKTLENIEDYVPNDILKKYNLPTLKTALIWIHKPKNARDAEAARKRFAFEEVFCIQLERQHDKTEWRHNKSFQISPAKKETDEFLKCFPFTPTNSQIKSIETTLSDMAKTFPMSRLLEGDVGSGKTAVAATAAYTVVNQKKSLANTRDNLQISQNLQVAYMAPTEILATQHFESFIQYFNSPRQGGASLPTNIGLITGSGCRKFPSKVNPSGWTDISRAQLLKWAANGEIPILIGTHALIQKTVKFKNLALVVIDEQHRFGTAQRQKLVRKDKIAPHLLSMTATPIPRTLALTIYGDLDLSLLEEMPLGRKPIITEIITPNKRTETYEKVREELKKGRQLYVICPRIDEPDPAKEMAVQAKSAVAEAKRLKKEVFREYEIGVLHSKMSKQKKEEVMKNFTEGKINILCATSVVEVGVNVPNATIIIIEGAERFGLAQLHQLRGRVIRSNHQAYCYVFASDSAKASPDKDAKNKTVQRLKALITAKNGFELAELDLTLRGAGELGGTKQWGITDLGMEAIKNLKMVEAARTEAIRLISEDPELLKYPMLKNKVREKVSEFHFE
ncbi:MAG: ATP-dependent DNA helicase RecG [bacterium]